MNGLASTCVTFVKLPPSTPVSALSYYRQRRPVPAYTLATPAFNNVLRQKHSFADHHSP